MMNYDSKIHRYIQKHRNEIVDTLKMLIRVPSVDGEKFLGAPFGKGCANILKAVKELYEKEGFLSELFEDDGYLLSYYGEGTNTVGIFSHADVVGIDNNWDFSSPFDPIEKDGYLFGRGVIDDKSGIIISLFSLKILKELKIPFSRKIVCFTGANEETGMNDIQNYLKKHNPPDYSIVPDTAFPLYRGNKGLIIFSATSKNKLSDNIIDFSSDKSGAIPAYSKMLIKSAEELSIQLADFNEENIEINYSENAVEISAKGISRHSALPEGAIHAGYLLSNYASALTCLELNDLKNFKFMSSLLNDFYGERTDIKSDDSDFGKLTIANTKIELINSHLSLTFNVRFGNALTSAEIKNRLTDFFENHNWTIRFEKTLEPKITDENNPYVIACLNAYKNFTGDNNATTRVNAGSTYARYLPNSVETGTSLHLSKHPNLPLGHGQAHQGDECINIDELLDAIELNVMMLLKCDEVKFDE